MAARWVQAIAAAAREAERAERRRLRALEQEARAQRKMADAQRRWDEAAQARNEVETFEARIEVLTSVHREARSPIAWDELARRPEPAAPAPLDLSSVGPLLAEEQAARDALEAHRPSWLSWFGLRPKRSKLEQDLEAATSAREAAEHRHRQAHEAALAAWVSDCEVWSETKAIAAGVLAGDVSAYVRVLEAVRPLDELIYLSGEKSANVSLGERHAKVELVAAEDTVVPLEELSLTSRGKVSKKKLAVARRNDIYQDYVCGAALRAGRELLATLPVDEVLVHVDAPMLDAASGRDVRRTILSVRVPRSLMDRTDIDWSRVDASELVATLEHRGSWKKTKGFAPVARLE